MKKNDLLNRELSYTIAKMGHTQTLTIGDAGLPIPLDVKAIDLALIKGIPSLLEVLDAVLTELCVEAITLADEIKETSPQIHKQIISRFPSVRINYVKHEVFKELSKDSLAIVRSGETTPYANIILHSGVTF